MTLCIHTLKGASLRLTYSPSSHVKSWLLLASGNQYSLEGLMLMLKLQYFGHLM